MGKKVREFKFIDLFSGVGGFHKAMEQLGGECVLACDIDKDCREVYEDNYKIKPFDDIRKLDLKDIPDHDVLCAGFPCQPFSKGGNQMGFKDSTRGTLFYEIIKILEYKKPRFIVLENVRNISSHDNGNTWKVIVESLHEIGYRVSSVPFIISPHRLSPKDGGAPQLRERVVILGERIEFSHSRGEEEVNLDWSFRPDDYPSSNWDPQSWDFKKWISTHQATETDLSPYILSKDDIGVLLTWGSFVRVLGSKLTSGFPIWNYAMKSRNNNAGLPDWKINFHNKNSALYKENKVKIDKWRTSKNVSKINPSKQKFEWQAQDSLRKKDSDIFELLIQFRPSGVRVKKATYVGALVAMVQTPIMGWLKRRITPSEAGSLQGFPMNFRRHKRDQVAYKQFGNAVNVNVIKFCTSKLFKRCGF